MYLWRLGAPGLQAGLERLHLFALSPLRVGHLLFLPLQLLPRTRALLVLGHLTRLVLGQRARILLRLLRVRVSGQGQWSGLGSGLGSVVRVRVRVRVSGQG